MRILAVGDVQFPAGAEYVAAALPAITRAEKADFVIVNGENTADNSALDERCARLLLASGADVITGGNHTLRRPEVYDFLDECSDTVIRPLNLPESAPGRGWTILPVCEGLRLLVINVMGQVMMDPCDNPFAAADRLLESKKGLYDLAVCDIHAEATSEKTAFAYYFNGRISCIFGTHTHVQTADERLLDRGTGYITDIGMCGTEDSVIGAEPTTAVNRFITRTFSRKKQPSGKMIICGALFETDNRTGYCVSVNRIKY